MWKIFRISDALAALALTMAVPALTPGVAAANGEQRGLCTPAINSAGIAYEALQDRETVHDAESVTAYRIKAQKAAYTALMDSMSSACGNRSMIAAALVLNAWVQEARGAEYMQLFQSTPTTSTCGRYYTLKLAYSLSTAWATLGAAKNKGGAQRDPFPHVESLLQYDAKSVGARLEPLGSTEALHHYERLQKQSEDAEQTYGRNCADIASV